MPSGRKSTYKPEYADRLVELMGQGYSLTAAMAQIGDGYHRQTAHDWTEAHPSFSDAIALGHAKRSFALETKGLAAASGPEVTYILAALKNCNQEDFRDKKEIQHSGALEVATKEQRDAAVAAAAQADT